MKRIVEQVRGVLNRAKRVGVTRQFATDHKRDLIIHNIGEPVAETVTAINKADVSNLKYTGIVKKEAGGRTVLMAHGIVPGPVGEHAELVRALAQVKEAFEKAGAGHYTTGAVSTYSANEIKTRLAKESGGATRTRDHYEELLSRIPELNRSGTHAHVVTLHFSAPANTAAAKSVERTLKSWQASSRIKRGGPEIGKHSVV